MSSSSSGTPFAAQTNQTLDLLPRQTNGHRISRETRCRRLQQKRKHNVLSRPRQTRSASAAILNRIAVYLPRRTRCSSSSGTPFAAQTNPNFGFAPASIAFRARESLSSPQYGWSGAECCVWTITSSSPSIRHCACAVAAVADEDAGIAQHQAAPDPSRSWNRPQDPDAAARAARGADAARSLPSHRRSPSRRTARALPCTARPHQTPFCKAANQRPRDLLTGIAPERIAPFALKDTEIDQPFHRSILAPPCRASGGRRCAFAIEGCRPPRPGAFRPGRLEPGAGGDRLCRG